jgi:hypothetical protein
MGAIIIFLDGVLLFGIKDVKPRRPPPALKVNEADGSISKEKTKAIKIAMS